MSVESGDEEGTPKRGEARQVNGMYAYDLGIGDMMYSTTHVEVKI